jgi:hypothetical protein
MSRREALATAALAVLPTSVGATSGRDEDGDSADERPPLPPAGQPEGYPRVEEFGGLNGTMDVPEIDEETSVRVDVHPNQNGMNIGLDLTFHGLEVGTALDPADARALGETLLEAADDVEAWQAANVTPEQRETYW